MIRSAVLVFWLVIAGLALYSSVACANTIMVGDAQHLREALVNAQPGDTIDIQPGAYFLSSVDLRQSGRAGAPIVVRAAIPGTVLLWSNQRRLIRLQGAHWHFQHLDFQGGSDADHALHLVGEASHVRIEDNRFQNFAAAIKANGAGGPGEFPDDVRVLRNVFVNDTPRSSRVRITAIDATGGRRWTIAENFIADIAADARSGRISHAALVRGGAGGVVFDRNVVLCEWQHAGGQRVGLSLGDSGTAGRQFDRRGMEGCTEDCPEVKGGRITNNVILNCAEEPALYLRNAQGVLVANNTAYNAFGIQAQGSLTHFEASDNLVSGSILARQGAIAEKHANIETGWFSTARLLQQLKRTLSPSVPEHRVIYAEWFDRIVRGFFNGLGSFLDWLANGFIGKGLASFERWFAAPAVGDFRLLGDERILAMGSAPLRVGHDFCGQQRLPPGDVGAFEYKAGECELATELRRRHGRFLTSLTELSEPAPPDWSSASLEPHGSPPLPKPLRIRTADPRTLSREVRDLQPGDWLRLMPGEYSGRLALHRIQGTAEHPIVISGPADGPPAVIRGRRGVNTVSLIDASHIVIRHLTLDGRGEDIAGVVAEGHGNYAHDITIEHLKIQNYGGSQGNSGITTRVPAWNWVIRHNEIRNVGTGLYLGRSEGTAPFVGGLIENNFVAETLGYNMQIKHQNVRDRLPNMPTEPRQTIIRYNVFSKAAGGSHSLARPNLLVGHWPPQGPGRYDRYLIYGNLFHENPHERLFQGEGNVALYNNLFVTHGGDAIRFLRHNHVPKDVHILQNTIVTPGVGIRIDHPDRSYRQVVAGNAIFAAKPLQLPRHIDAGVNFDAEYPMAGDLLMNPNVALDRLDLFPRGRMLQHADAIGTWNGLPDLDRDYNGRVRERPYWGGYAGGAAGNQGREGDRGPRVDDCLPCR